LASFVGFTNRDVLNQFSEVAQLRQESTPPGCAEGVKLAFGKVHIALVRYPDMRVSAASSNDLDFLEVLH